MARKNLLTGLLGDELPAGNSPKDGPPSSPNEAAADRQPSFGQNGAIGAVTRSIEQLKSQIGEAKHSSDPPRATPSLSSIRDLSSGPSLRTEWREHSTRSWLLPARYSGSGPVGADSSLRRIRLTSGRLRSRLWASTTRSSRCVLRASKCTVVKELSDVELVIAQGLREKSARTPLPPLPSERFIFRRAARTRRASIVRDHGSADDRQNRAFKIDLGCHQIPARNFPPQLDLLRKQGEIVVGFVQCDRKPRQRRNRCLILRCDSPIFRHSNRTCRFLRLFNALAPKRQKESDARRAWVGHDGKKVGRIQQDDRELVLTIDKRVAPDFWLMPPIAS